MKNEIVFNKYCDIDLKHSLKYIDADINECMYALYELADLRYKVDYYLTEGKRTYHFKLSKEVDFLQIIHGDFLFVSTLSENEEDNAFLYDRNDKCIQSFHVGTGVEVCKADREGRIWIGYNDEGVFELDALGQNGIACFSKEGNVLFNQYDRFVNNGWVPPIDYCNAVSISEKGVWICYYSDYALVHIESSETVYLWGKLDVGLVEWIAVGNDEAVIGTTGDIFRVHLRTREQCEVTFFDENRHRLKLDRIFTSGHRIFGISNGMVYVSDIL